MALTQEQLEYNEIVDREYKTHLHSPQYVRRTIVINEISEATTIINFMKRENSGDILELLRINHLVWLKIKEMQKRGDAKKT